MNSSNFAENIVEIFSSIQGEGPYIGTRHLFVRFPNCNLKCEYCDTEFNPQKYCKVEICPGSGDFKKIENPLTVDQLIYKINELTYFPHHSLSLTGGEPLLCVAFLKDFLPEYLRKKTDKGIKIYLETNGSLPDELSKVIDFIDIISMDIKIKSSTGIKTPWDEHREFIKVAQSNNKELFAKLVITGRISNDELSEIKEQLCLLQSQIPVILQPISTKETDLIPKPDQLLSIQENLLKKLDDVRIIPQMHKFLNLL